MQRGRIEGLLVALALFAGCGPEDKGGGGGAFSALLDEEFRYYSWACACLVEIDEFVTTTSCIGQVVYVPHESVIECADDVISTRPSLSEHLTCQTAALEEFTDCASNKACEDYFEGYDGYYEEFECANGYSIPEYWVCDDYDDCGDGSDEEGCPPPAPTECADALMSDLEGCPEPDEEDSLALYEACGVYLGGYYYYGYGDSEGAGGLDGPMSAPMPPLTTSLSPMSVEHARKHDGAAIPRPAKRMSKPAPRVRGK